MFETLPQTAEEIRGVTWPRIAPYYDDLLARVLTAENVGHWLGDWSRLTSLLDEMNTRYVIATTTNTADEEAERGYTRYLDEIAPRMAEAEQRVKEKLLASGLEPAGFAVPLRKIRADAELYRDANVPLLSEQRKLVMEYEKIAGARTAAWDGEQVTMPALEAKFDEPDRGVRERAWRLRIGRILEDTPALADVWRRMVAVRRQLGRNAGFDSYRPYRWRQLFRFDYTPEDTKRFHAAIEEVVVPAAARMFARRRELLGVEAIRPWDMWADPFGREALHPFATVDELEEKAGNVFHRVAPRFGEYFAAMRAEGMLDLASRPNKAPGGYMVGLAATRRGFIFANAVGGHDDVMTLLHEGGHAFHAFESAGLPYLQQWSEQWVPIEFAEVASMGMELLGSPYLARRDGGFYSEAEAARGLIDKCRGMLHMWPYIAMIDALQHWVYEHEDEAGDIERCDDVWAGLVDRFWPYVDWSGLEREKRSYWHEKGHPFADPFYYVEYGMAQLGSVQLWANALRDQQGAVAAYRRALALGGTATLPELYAAAGIRFAFDAETLRRAVDLIEEQMARLEPVAAN
jgi:oligoendopeptidase F